MKNPTGRIEKVQEFLNSLSGHILDLQSDLNQAEEDLRESESEAMRIQSELDQSEEENNDLKRQVEDNQIALQCDNLGRRIAAERIVSLFNQLSNDEVETLVSDWEKKNNLDSLPMMYRNPQGVAV